MSLDVPWNESYVAAVHRVQNICLHQEHEVTIPSHDGQIAWVSPNPQLSWMLYVHMFSPMGQDGRICGGARAKCSQSPPCHISWVKLINIFLPCLWFHLISIWKCAVLPPLEYTRVCICFSYTPSVATNLLRHAPLLQFLVNEYNVAGHSHWYLSRR